MAVWAFDLQLGGHDLSGEPFRSMSSISPDRRGSACANSRRSLSKQNDICPLSVVSTDGCTKCIAVEILRRGKIQYGEREMKNGNAHGFSGRRTMNRVARAAGLTERALGRFGVKHTSSSPLPPCRNAQADGSE